MTVSKEMAWSHTQARRRKTFQVVVEACYCFPHSCGKVHSLAEYKDRAFALLLCKGASDYMYPRPSFVSIHSSPVSHSTTTTNLCLSPSGFDHRRSGSISLCERVVARLLLLTTSHVPSSLLAEASWLYKNTCHHELTARPHSWHSLGSSWSLACLYSLSG